MEEKPLQSVYYHYRFKFLAITCIAFLLYIILSSSSEFEQFASSPQFKLLGPFLIGAGVLFFLFRKFPIKCPSCYKVISTKKNWHCPSCDKPQGKERFLMEKCIHCKEMLSTYHCDYCKKEFRL